MDGVALAASLKPAASLFKHTWGAPSFKPSITALVIHLLEFPQHPRSTSLSSCLFGTPKKPCFWSVVFIFPSTLTIDIFGYYNNRSLMIKFSIIRSRVCVTKSLLIKNIGHHHQYHLRVRNVNSPWDTEI